MRKKSLIWKIPCIGIGVILGIVLLLLIAATVVLVTPRARTAVLNKCVKEVNERTDLDVDLGRLYLSPFHHSPMVLYRAYKGTEDLPLHIEIDSLYVGHFVRSPSDVFAVTIGGIFPVQSIPQSGPHNRV